MVNKKYSGKTDKRPVIITFKRDKEQRIAEVEPKDYDLYYNHIRKINDGYDIKQEIPELDRGLGKYETYNRCYKFDNPDLAREFIKQINAGSITRGRIPKHWKKHFNESLEKRAEEFEEWQHEFNKNYYIDKLKKEREEEEKLPWATIASAAMAGGRFGIVFVFLGAFFLSSNMTGNVIGLSSNSSNIIGSVLLVIGLVACFSWVKSKKNSKVAAKSQRDDRKRPKKK